MMNIHIQRTFMRFRFFLVCLLFLPLASAPGQSAKALTILRKAVSTELDGPLFSRCLAGVEIADAASGEVLFARNEQLLLRPASNAKLVTSAAAVLGLPADFHFETRLAAADSAMRTLICIGGGDPLFTEQDIQKLAEIAFASGTSSIDTLIMDAALYADEFYGHGWMWDDEPDPFTPYLNPFSIANNTVVITVKRALGKTGEVEFSTTPASDMFTFEQYPATRTGYRIERLPRSNHYRIHGMPRSGVTERDRFSIWQPQKLFAEMLLRALRQQGIATDSAVVQYSVAQGVWRELGSVRRRIDDVLASMNKSSNNLSAEAVLRALSFGTGHKMEGVSAQDGLAAMEGILRKNGIRTDGIVLSDGSGISFYNLVTATALGSLLRVLAKHPSAARYRSSLAIGGKDGTLRNRMQSLPPASDVLAKTGTVRGISALSGYVQAPGGRLLTVVLLMQNFTGSHSPYKSVQDRIMKHCLEYSASFTPVRQPR
jgi:serine-type D-Ala-D-Ala carboxypeptidase/endopeptidase (penicillin-binding protein 4)